MKGGFGNPAGVGELEGVQLKVVISAIKEYDDALEQLLEQHQDTPIFLSLPSLLYKVFPDTPS
jgi:hypothetical protein